MEQSEQKPHFGSWPERRARTHSLPPTPGSPGNGKLGLHRLRDPETRPTLGVGTAQPRSTLAVPAPPAPSGVTSSKPCLVPGGLQEGAATGPGTATLGTAEPQGQVSSW